MSWPSLGRIVFLCVSSPCTLERGSLGPLNTESKHLLPPCRSNRCCTNRGGGTKIFVVSPSLAVALAAAPGARPILPTFLTFPIRTYALTHWPVSLPFARTAAYTYIYTSAERCLHMLVSLFETLATDALENLPTRRDRRSRELSVRSK